MNNTDDTAIAIDIDSFFKTTKTNEEEDKTIEVGRQTENLKITYSSLESHFDDFNIDSYLEKLKNNSI